CLGALCGGSYYLLLRTPSSACGWCGEPPRAGRGVPGAKVLDRGTPYATALGRAQVHYPPRLVLPVPAYADHRSGWGWARGTTPEQNPDCSKGPMNADTRRGNLGPMNGDAPGNLGPMNFRGR
ncbi:MAG TPA: hypothetical protein VGD71_08850, partial [Kribbella sp.]